jgi:hypothetical protein
MSKLIINNIFMPFDISTNYVQSEKITDISLTVFEELNLSQGSPAGGHFKILPPTPNKNNCPPIIDPSKQDVEQDTFFFCGSTVLEGLWPPHI